MDYKHTNKGFYVGTFDEKQIKNGEDEVAVEKAKQSTGCKYVNTEYVKKGKKIVGLKLYVCTADEMKLTF